MIYFDNNATTPIDVRVLEAMLPYLRRFHGNPSSLYRLGRVSRSAIETAREQVAALVLARPDQVIFTSGGTEANNLAINNVPANAAVAISAIEHPSVFEPAIARKSYFRQFSQLAVDDNGVVQPSGLQAMQWVKGDFASIMLANNETGVVQDIPALTAELKTNGVTVHTDAVQALGKIPVSFPALGVDLMSLSGHKIYGPKGSGALVVGEDIALSPQLLGGGQEYGCRAGTENVAAIVGFGRAAQIIMNELGQRHKKLGRLRSALEGLLLDIPGVTVLAEQAQRLPNTVMFAIKNVDGEMLLMQLDKQGIAVSSGSACASAGGHPSPVLKAMGVDPELSKGAIRVSLGKDNTEQEVNDFIVVLKKIINV
jgi:cysteine desulfurase